MAYAIDFKDEKMNLMKTLERHVSSDQVENIVDVLFDFAFSELE